MRTPMFVNPYRFRARLDKHLLLGAVNQSVQIPYRPALEVLEQGEEVIFPHPEISESEWQWLEQERYIVHYKIARDNRYARQLGFFGFWPGDPHQRQQRLAAARVAILGVGTLGTQVAYLLTAAGVGHLVLCDQDVVEPSNLSRQLLFVQQDIGKPKVLAARERLGLLNPTTRITVFHEMLDSPSQIEQRVAGCDLIVRAVDTPQDIAFLIDEAATKHGIPHVGAGLLETWTMVGPFVDSRYGPSLRELITPPEFVRSPYREIPVFGPTAFWAASYVAGDALRYLADLGQPWTANRILYLDGRSGQMYTRDLRSDVASGGKT